MRLCKQSITHPDCIPSSLQVKQSMQQWMLLQQLWLELSPMFGAEAKSQLLPVDNKRFVAVDRNLRKMVDAAKRNCATIKVDLTSVSLIMERCVISFINSNMLVMHCSALVLPVLTVSADNFIAALFASLPVEYV
jgi:hypothetical protein